MPAKPMSAYEFYSKNNRHKVIESMGVITFEECQRILRDRFKKLSVEELNIYLNMERRDKERYQKQLKMYSGQN
jgi:hypothetical protein